MSNPRNPIVGKKSILRGVLDVCRRGEGLSHWMSCVDGGLLLAVTKTHHQTQVRHDRGQDDLKTGFGEPEFGGGLLLPQAEARHQHNSSSDSSPLHADRRPKHRAKWISCGQLDFLDSISTFFYCIRAYLVYSPM